MKTLSELQQNMLALVGHFGHLTNREVAELNTPGRAPDSAMVTAQTAGRRLVDLGLLLPRKLEHDNLSTAYVLTTAGAEYLNQEYMAEWLEHASPGAWFNDGYNLSLMQWLARRPLTKLAAEVAAGAGLHPVGQRSLKRDFLGLGRYRHFDAVLLNDAGLVVFGVVQAHGTTKAATEHVCKLAQGTTAFIIASDTPTKLFALMRWRATTCPTMADYVLATLPAGITA